MGIFDVQYGTRAPTGGLSLGRLKIGRSERSGHE